MINSACFPSAGTDGYQTDEYDWSAAWTALLVARRLGASAATEAPVASAADEDLDEAAAPPPSKAEAPLEFRVALSLCLAYIALQRGFYADALAAAEAVLAIPLAVALDLICVGLKYCE